MSKNLVVDPKKCVGCRTCELACSFGHFKEINPTLARVKVFHYEEDMISVPVVCLQCDEASCAAVCPTGALQRNDDGVIVHDDSKCIKCKQCVNACPLGNVSYSPRIQNVFKCDQCDGDPMCVKFCPTHAIYLVEEGDDRAKQKEAADKLKEEALKERGGE